MLKHTFLHTPGVGPAIERKLWDCGILSWEHWLEGCSTVRLNRRVSEALDAQIERSIQALAAGNARFFEESLPVSEAWRMYGEFRESVAFLDIETTGLSLWFSQITVIGLFDGHDVKVFVRGINLDDFPREIQRHSLLVTFNGKRFDLPFLRQTFGELPPHVGHLDLRYPLRRLGYSGGLKRIELQVGIEREGALREVDGFLAVLLWREYEKGNRAALQTLMRYNMEDVVNLQHLADLAYNQLLANLPLPVEPLPVHPKRVVDIPFDAELIEYLRHRASLGWLR